eukprot:5322647-Karenia_brevis.AAC.1
MKESKHSRTASSKLLRAHACSEFGTIRKEYTSFPKDAQWRSRSKATEGSGTSPISLRSRVALLTRSCVCWLQKHALPTGPPR